VTAEDSGELITAAYTLGIAHPPGYPLWCMLGKLFTFIPLGTVAWRVNLLSAVLGATAVGILALLAHRFTRNGWISLTAALLYGVSRDFWSQCVIAEVYTLNMLFILLVLFLLFRFEDALKTRWLYLAAFTLGLGLTAHSTLGPLAVVFFAWIFLRHRYLFLRPILLLNLCGAFLLGLSIVLYLPIRSATDPFLDWGKPETIGGAIAHFLRKQYTDAAQPRPRTVLGQAALVYHFLGTFAAQFTPPAGALAILGAMENLRKERKTFILLGVLFGLTTYGFMWLLNYPADRENLHLTAVFFLPANAVAALWIALALSRLEEWARERFHQGLLKTRLALASIATAIVLVPAALHFRDNDMSQDYLAYDWGRNIFSSLKPDSIILPSADHSTFPLLHLQAVEGLRPDVIVGDKYGYIEDRVFRDLFKGKNTPRVAPPLGGSHEEKQRYLVAHSGKAVYFSTKTQIAGLDNHELITWGLVFEAVRKGTKPVEEEHRKLWETFSFHAGQLDQLPGDFSRDLILADYHYARARFALLFEREEEAIGELRTSERHGFGVKEIHNNLGGTLAEAGKAELALPFFRNALAVDPDYDMATRNLANALFSLRRYQEGLPYFESALKLDPQNPLPQVGIARAHRDMGMFVESYFDFLSALARDPHNVALREEVTELALSTFGEDSALTRLVAEKPKVPKGEFDADSSEEGSLATSADPNPPTPWAPDPVGNTPDDAFRTPGPP